jgi:hypothetical protein
MQRRQFVRTSAGFLAAAAAPGAWSLDAPADTPRKISFTGVQDAGAIAPIHCVTPPDGAFVHTYYDVCAWSPSGRYIAATRLPYEDRYPELGSIAQACIIDTQEQSIQTVYRTRVWGFQTGANLNWGGTDRYLYANETVDGIAVCARIDLESRSVKLFSGPQYNTAPDDSCVIGFPLELMDATQLGYGAPTKDPLNPPTLPTGAAKDQGLWRTDLKTNRKTLLVSLAALAESVNEPPPKPNGTWYLWHCKHSPDATRILQVTRCLFPGETGPNTMVFTFKPDGSDIRLLPTKPLWGAGGGHPNWHGDSRHIIRNLPIEGKTRLCQWLWDGSGFRVLSDRIEGGGHPRIEPSGRYIVTDAFEHDGTQWLALRLIDLKMQQEQRLCRIKTIDRRPLTGDLAMVRRLDGHPTWSRDYKRVLFQAAPAGRRQLYVMDLSKILG